jgi:hypothetical protein
LHVLSRQKKAIGAVIEDISPYFFFFFFLFFPLDGINCPEERNENKASE